MATALCVKARKMLCNYGHVYLYKFKALSQRITRGPTTTNLTKISFLNF
jgi:hypothetical protein